MVAAARKFENWEIRIGHVGILKGALTGLGLSGETPEGASEPPVASAMRLLDKGDDAGLAELFSSNGIAPENAAPLRALSQLEGGRETLGPAQKFFPHLLESLLKHWMICKLRLMLSPP